MFKYLHDSIKHQRKFPFHRANFNYNFPFPPLSTLLTTSIFPLNHRIDLRFEFNGGGCGREDSSAGRKWDRMNDELVVLHMLWARTPFSEVYLGVKRYLLFLTLFLSYYPGHMFHSALPLSPPPHEERNFPRSYHSARV